MILFVDSQVLAAQRAYGLYLAGQSTGESSALLGAARAAYGGLMKRCELKNRECQYEVARLLSEPATLRDLSLDPVEIVLCCPDEWQDTLLGRWTFTTGDHVRMFERLTETGRNPSAVVRRMLDFAIRHSDRSTATWVAYHAIEPHRSVAHQAVGQFLETEASQLLHRNPNDPTTFQPTFDVVEAITDWLNRSGGYSIDPSMRERVRHMAHALRHRRTEAEGRLILDQLSTCFQWGVSDLARWSASVEHLCRRAELWRDNNHTVPHLVALATELSAQAARAREHARSWGQTYAVPAGMLPGQAPPGIPGSCPFCVTMIAADARFCPQCGANLPITGSAEATQKRRRRGRGSR